MPKKPLLEREPIAEQDIRRTFLYLYQDNTTVAQRFLKSVLATEHLIAYMPYVGKRFLDTSSKCQDVRRIVVDDFPTFLVYYAPIELEDGRTGVRIIRVLHSSRDYRKLI